MIAAAPDYLLVVDYRATDGRQAVADRVLQLPGIGLTPAGRDKRVIVMNGARLLGFGPRMPEALMDLAKQLQGSAQITVSQGQLND